MDEARIHHLVHANGAVAPGVQIVHRRLELGAGRHCQRPQSGYIITPTAGESPNERYSSNPLV